MITKDDLHYKDEVKLMGFGMSDTSGEWIKLQIDPDALESFKGFKGERFYMTLSLLGNDEKPVKAVKKQVGPRCWDAVQFCKSEDYERYTREVDPDIPPIEHFLRFCRIESRSELDKDDEAHDRFVHLAMMVQAWAKAHPRT